MGRQRSPWALHRPGGTTRPACSDRRESSKKSEAEPVFFSRRCRKGVFRPTEIAPRWRPFAQGHAGRHNSAGPFDGRRRLRGSGYPQTRAALSRLGSTLTGLFGGSFERESVDLPTRFLIAGRIRKRTKHCDFFLDLEGTISGSLCEHEKWINDRWGSLNSLYWEVACSSQRIRISRVLRENPLRRLGGQFSLASSGDYVINYSEWNRSWL